MKKLFQDSLQQIKIMSAVVFFLFGMVVYAQPAKKNKRLFKDIAGVHGRVTSITRFAPFELYDDSQSTFRDLSFEYLVIRTPSEKMRKIIYPGASEYILGDEVCLLFKPLNYGNVLLKDFFEEEDPARNILALSHFRLVANGMMVNLSFSHCLLCADEHKKIYVVYLEKDKGSCKHWKDNEGISYVRIEADEKNFGEANSEEGCLMTGGSGGCYAVPYREY